MVTETSGTRTGTLDSEYENIGIIPIYFVFHCPLGLWLAQLELSSFLAFWMPEWWMVLCGVSVNDVEFVHRNIYLLYYY